MDPFISHMTQHLRTFLPPADEVQSGEAGAHACCWDDCDHEIESVFEYIRHVYFHCFHSKLKCTGNHIMDRVALSRCQLDPKSRNLIPELPENLMCAWSHCYRVFENPYYFYCHVADHVGTEYTEQHTKYKCLWDGCSTTVKTKTKLKEHLRSHTQEKLVACPTCGSLFSNNSKFNDHVVRQTEGEVQSYECTHCNKRFATERILKDHVRQHVHKYRCPYCEMTCLTNAAFQSHIKFKHMEARGFKCSECSYTAKTVNDLKKHSESHEEKFFACTVSGCNYTARHFYSLTRHFKSMHQNEGKLFMCHLCYQRYTRGEKLTKHLRNNHNLQWPSGSGNHRFRYVIHDDGLYRLQTVRYESTDIESNSPEKGSRVIKVHLTAEPGPPQKPAKRTSKQLPQGDVTMVTHPQPVARRPRKSGNLSKVGKVPSAVKIPDEQTNGVTTGKRQRRVTGKAKGTPGGTTGCNSVIATGGQETDGVAMPTASLQSHTDATVNTTAASNGSVTELASKSAHLISPELITNAKPTAIWKSKRTTRQTSGKFIRNKIEQLVQQAPDNVPQTCHTVKNKQTMETLKPRSKRKRSRGVEKEEFLSAKIKPIEITPNGDIELDSSASDYSYNLDLLGDVALKTPQLLPKTSTPYPKTVQGRVRVQRGLKGSIIEFPDVANNDMVVQHQTRGSHSVTVQESVPTTISIQNIYSTRQSHIANLPSNIQVEEGMPKTIIVQNTVPQIQLSTNSDSSKTSSFDSTDSCAAYMESLLQSPEKDGTDLGRERGEGSRPYMTRQVVTYGSSPTKADKGAGYHGYAVKENADFTELQPSAAL